MEGIQTAPDITSWLEAGRRLFLLVDLLGIACFAYLVSRRIRPFFRAERDPRFDRPLARLGRVLKYWLAQWKQPRYLLAGVLHAVIFAGFLALSIRSISLVALGISPHLTMPIFSGRLDEFYDAIKDYAATLVFGAVVFCAIRRAIFKPAQIGRASCRERV